MQLEAYQTNPVLFQGKTVMTSMLLVTVIVARLVYMSAEVTLLLIANFKWMVIIG